MFTIPTSFAIKALLSVQFDQSDSAAQRGQIDQRAVACASACTLKRSAILSKAKCSEQNTRIPITIAKTPETPWCDLICVDRMLAVSCLQNNSWLHLFLDLLIVILVGFSMPIRQPESQSSSIWVLGCPVQSYFFWPVESQSLNVDNLLLTGKRNGI